MEDLYNTRNRNESDEINRLSAEVNDLLPALAAKLIHFVKEAPGSDITVGQGFLLWHLAQHGPCTASTIGDFMDITSGPVTSLTKRLIAKGMLERRQDETDGRVFWFSLTPKGEQLASQLAKYQQAQWARVLEQLGAKRARETIQLMEDTIRILNDLS